MADVARRKFGVPMNPIVADYRSKGIEPTPTQMHRAKNYYLQQAMTTTTDDAVKDEIQRLKTKELYKGLEGQIKSDFEHRFDAFLMGRMADKPKDPNMPHSKDPVWGYRNISHMAHPEVKRYINQKVEARAEFEKYLAIMQRFGPIGYNTKTGEVWEAGMFELYIYFKYILEGDAFEEKDFLKYYAMLDGKRSLQDDYAYVFPSRDLGRGVQLMPAGDSNVMFVDDELPEYSDTGNDDKGWRTRSRNWSTNPAAAMSLSNSVVDAYFGVPGNKKVFKAPQIGGAAGNNQSGLAFGSKNSAFKSINAPGGGGGTPQPQPTPVRKFKGTAAVLGRVTGRRSKQTPVTVAASPNSVASTSTAPPPSNQSTLTINPTPPQTPSSAASTSTAPAPTPSPVPQKGKTGLLSSVTNAMTSFWGGRKSKTPTPKTPSPKTVVAGPPPAGASPSNPITSSLNVITPQPVAKSPSPQNPITVAMASTPSPNPAASTSTTPARDPDRDSEGRVRPDQLRKYYTDPDKRGELTEADIIERGAPTRGKGNKPQKGAILPKPTAERLWDATGGDLKEAKKLYSTFVQGRKATDALPKGLKKAWDEFAQTKNQGN